MVHNHSKHVTTSGAPYSPHHQSEPLPKYWHFRVMQFHLLSMGLVCHTPTAHSFYLHYKLFISTDLVWFPCITKFSCFLSLCIFGFVATLFAIFCCFLFVLTVSRFWICMLRLLIKISAYRFHLHCTYVIVTKQ